MRKIKPMTAITAILPLLFLCALTLLPAGAASEGFEDLAVAASGKNPLMNPEFIDGGQGFNEKEHSYGLLVYDEDEDENQKLYPKYCSDAVPYWAEWKYDRAYAVNRIILRTANDSGQYSRRPNDGWTLSGSNDGASWEVLYTGAANDVEDVDYMYYRVDIPNNSKEFQYYRFEAGQTGGQIIQLAAVVLCEGEGPVVVASWKPKNFILEEGKTTIPATDFDAGADNYGKSGDPADGSKDFRPLEAVNTQAGGGAIEGNIGWISAGDWVQFTVRVIDEGRYSFAAWLASDAESPGNIAVYVDGEPVGESENSKRAGWQEYELYQVGEMEMEYGRHTIKTQFPTGGLNFGALEITRIGDIETPLPTQTGAEPGGKEEAPPENGASEIKASDEGGRSNLVLIIIVAAALAATIVAAVIYTAKNGGKNK